MPTTRFTLMILFSLLVILFLIVGAERYSSQKSDYNNKIQLRRE